MKNLLVLFVLTFSGFTNAQNVHPVECDGSELLSNYNTIIHRFSFEKECRKALEESQYAKGHFCDDDQLFWPNGQLFHNFNWDSRCQAALEQFALSSTGLFCDGSAMFQITLGKILDHRFESECKEALVQARDYRGLFCRDGKMFDQWGRLIRDYSFSRSCKEALKKIR